MASLYLPSLIWLLMGLMSLVWGLSMGDQGTSQQLEELTQLVGELKSEIHSIKEQTKWLVNATNRLQLAGRTIGSYSQCKWRGKLYIVQITVFGKMLVR